MQQVGGDLVVDEVAGDDAANGVVGGGADAFVDDLELATELRGRPRAVHGAQDALPKPAANRKQGVVSDIYLLVLLPLLYLGVPQVTVDFGAALFDDILNVVNLVRPLGEDDGADDRLHVGVGQFDGHGEAVLQLAELRRAGQRGLPRGDEQQFAAEPLGAALGHLLDHVRAERVLPDVLLNFI